MIRAAQPGDLHRVTDLIRQSFDPKLRPYMVYAQHGAASFLGAYLEHPHLSADRVMLVAEDDDGRACAFVEFRLSGSASAHLSYICVHPDARGRGLARRLIGSFARDTGVRDIDLFVFKDNTAALSLYQSMGLAAVGGTAWFVRPLPAAVERRSIVGNLPSALAAYDRFGFCELKVATAAGVAKIGRIGTRVLRCGDAASFCDDNLLGSMAGAFPEAEEALLIAPYDPGVGHVVNASIHMAGRISS